MQPNYIMKTNIKIGVLGIFALLMAFSSCRKKTDASANKLIAGHYGCEQYVSCRTNEDGSSRWDTVLYEACAGGEYEVFFNENGSGQLLLNNSPALIKKFSCSFDYDTTNQIINIESDSWLYALYGSLFLEENHAEFHVDELTNSYLIASWTNNVSEPEPFFERFFLKKID